MTSGPSGPAGPALVSRRRMLARSGTGFGMLGLASLLSGRSQAASGGELDTPAAGPQNPLHPLAPKPAHSRPRAKSVIFLFMNGGPSHVDTFDPKPALRRAAERKGLKGRRYMPSPFSFSPQGSSGIEVSELYPHVSRSIDDLTIARSMYTSTPNHEPGLFMMNCGVQQPLRPSLGSWLCYGLGSENQNLPGFVVLCPGKPVVGPQLWSSSFLPGIFQGTHINNKSVDPEKVIPHLKGSGLGTGDQRRLLNALQNLNREHLARAGADNELEARIESLEMAFRMQFEAQEAFDVSRETAATRALYGEGAFAQGCLLSRRLVERGVRMVQLYYGAGQPWDAHGNIMDHRLDAAKSDQAIAALLTDLKSHGLLDETLVLWGGEFGRTPTAQGGRGRDHHATGFTMWLAGGGVKGGYVHGATAELGVDAIEKRTSVHDLHATILQLMDVDDEQLVYRYSGRDFRLTDVHGRVMHDIIA